MADSTGAIPGVTPFAPEPTPKTMGAAPGRSAYLIKGVEGGLGAASDGRVVVFDVTNAHVFPLRHGVPPTEGFGYGTNEGDTGVLG